MTIWIIAAVYQGDFTGIELATTNEEKAEERYEELVRQALGMPEARWGEVMVAYTRALDACQRIDELYLEEIVVEGGPTGDCSYCSTGEMRPTKEYYDQGGYSTVALECTDCGAQQVIKNIPPEKD